MVSRERWAPVTPGGERPSSQEGDLDGRIPFRIRFGVTGHRDLEDPAALGEAVRRQLRRIAHGGVLRIAETTPVRLAAVSQLAEGADRLLVRQVEQLDPQAHVEAILPMMPIPLYAEKASSSPASRAEFLEILKGAARTWHPPRDDFHSNAEAYQAAGRQLVVRCDVLIALWDGEATGGPGGTCETLLEAAWRGKPCIWIHASDPRVVIDNLADGSAQAFYETVLARSGVPPDRVPGERILVDQSVLTPLREAYAGLVEFNRGRAGPPRLRHRDDEADAPSDMPAWAAMPFLRATVRARRYQWRFKLCAGLVFLLAVVAAVALGMSVAFDDRSPWAWAEFGSLFGAVVLIVLIHLAHFHSRWLTYRILAERLRPARYLAGMDIRPDSGVGLEGVYVDHHSIDWVLRAADEVWSRAQPGRDGADVHLPTLRPAVVRWIDDQVHYHARAKEQHDRWHRVLSVVTVVAVLSTVVLAAWHAAEAEHDLTVFFSIALPAFGASCGAFATLRQDRALAQRCGQMANELAVARFHAAEAETHSALMAATRAAARIIARESGGWFGVMWFLDVEHL